MVRQISSGTINPDSTEIKWQFISGRWWFNWSSIRVQTQTRALGRHRTSCGRRYGEMWKLYKHKPFALIFTEAILLIAAICREVQEGRKWTCWFVEMKLCERCVRLQRRDSFSLDTMEFLPTLQVLSFVWCPHNRSLETGPSTPSVLPLFSATRQCTHFLRRPVVRLSEARAEDRTFCQNSLLSTENIAWWR